MASVREESITQLIDELRNFRFCGPSDDPDEQTAVTSGYQYLATRLRREAVLLLSEAEQNRLNSIHIEIDNLYSAYEAKAEIDALLPVIETAMQQSGEAIFTSRSSSWIVNPTLIDEIERASSTTLDLALLLHLCREVNSCFAHGNIIATVLLMRAVLNYVPPAFGCNAFKQVVAQSPKSLKNSFDHLEQGLRQIADFHTHRVMTRGDSYPTVAQVEPYKPQFEQLLQEVLQRSQNSAP